MGYNGVKSNEYDTIYSAIGIMELYANGKISQI